MNLNENHWQVRAQTQNRKLDINVASVTHMSYSSRPAEAVFSALRSIVYISYCENTRSRSTMYKDAWEKVVYLSCFY